MCIVCGGVKEFGSITISYIKQAVCIDQTEIEKMEKLYAYAYRYLTDIHKSLRAEETTKI